MKRQISAFQLFFCSLLAVVLFLSTTTMAHAEISNQSEVPFVVESLDSLPDDVYNQMEEMRFQPYSGIEVVPKEDRTYIILSLGLRPSTGYEIMVNRVVQDGDHILVWATEIPPSDDEVVLPVLTSPVKVISIPPSLGEASELDMKIHVK
ncbi:protease complex subunit PrcB family protein [Desmospora profundinema]|uniref:Methionine-rich copper-binding protein CopC n=1 Tax=Desmospora profundinema TaxID=1571184 RepID=A0ABU1IPQ0_9BACL|nr:protease complex subunit PrcB family protein [Desmospora profundinema]MDR6226774.1 methionine-rich copper-binding protein CopC [Desmospora profundinema]